MFQSPQQLSAGYATELLCHSAMCGGRFILGFAAQNSALYLLAGRWHIPRQLRHCIAHCRYGSDFAHSTLLLQLCRGSRQVDYFRSLQHDGGGLAAAGLLQRSHTAGTLDCGPVVAPAGNVLPCVHKHHTLVYRSVIFAVTAIL